MSCNLSPLDIESKLVKLWENDPVKYKDLSNIATAILSSTVLDGSAKIHAIWYSAKFIGSIANKIPVLQTQAWKDGAYARLAAYLDPIIKGETTLVMKDAVSTIGDILTITKLPAVKATTLEERLNKLIERIPTTPSYFLVDSVNAILKLIQDNKSILDYTSMDSTSGTANMFLGLLNQRLNETAPNINKLTLIDKVNKVKKSFSEEENTQSYRAINKIEGIGKYNGEDIKRLQRADNSILDVVFDKGENKYVIYAPNQEYHLEPITFKAGDKLYNYYASNNPEFVSTDGKLRLAQSELLYGIAVSSRVNYGSPNKRTAEQEMSHMLATSGGKINSRISIRATKKITAANAKRFERIKELIPSINRSFDTEERPFQADSLVNDRQPILTTMRPVEGFSIMISTFDRTNSFELEAIVNNLAFVYPDNTTVKVNFEDESHLALLKSLAQVRIPMVERAGQDKYQDLSDENINSLVIAARTYSNFEKEVNARLAENAGEDVNIMDIFYKYYSLQNSTVKIDYVSNADVESTLGEYIDKHNGRLDVKLQNFDESGNPIGEPESSKIAIVTRKVKGVWQVEDTMEPNQKIVTEKGTYSSIDSYLRVEKDIDIHNVMSKLANEYAIAMYLEFVDISGMLTPHAVPLVYEQQVKSDKDLVNFVGGLQYTLNRAKLVEGNNYLSTFLNDHWGFSTDKNSGISPEIKILSSKKGINTYGITFKMIPARNNNEDKIENFNRYSESFMNIVIDNNILYNKQDGLFQILANMFEKAKVTVGEEPTIETINALTAKVFNILGEDDPLVKQLRNIYNKFSNDILNKFNAAVDKHDIALEKGLLEQSIFDSDDIKKHVLFDNGTLRINKRTIGADPLSAFSALKTVKNTRLNVSFKDPNKFIYIPVPRKSVQKVLDESKPAAFPQSVDIDYKESKEEQIEEIVKESTEIFDVNELDTENGAWSITDTIENIIILNPEEFEEERALMKSLMPNSFKWYTYNFGAAINIDGKALGFYQKMAMHVNATYRAKGVAYHEGFHGLFRNVLNERQQKYYLQKVEKVLGNYKVDSEGKYILVNGKKVYADFFRKQRRYVHLNDEEIRNLIYEEYIADSFSDYLTANKVPKTFLEKLFAYFKKFLNLLKVGGKIDNLFIDISLGKFADATTLDYKSNVDRVYSGNYNAIPHITYSSDGTKPIKRNGIIESFVASEVSAKMIDKMIELTQHYPYMNSNSLYSLAAQIVIRNYDVNALVVQNPSKEDEILRKYSEFYDNARWLLGAFHINGENFALKNYTNRTDLANSVMSISDKSQLKISKANAERFKRDVLEEYDNLDVIFDYDNVDDQIRRDDIEFEEQHEIGAFNDIGNVNIPPSEGNAGFRRMFKYIEYEYIDPVLNIKRMRMVDSKLIFSTIRKITWDLPKEQIIPRLSEEVIRLNEFITNYNNKILPRLLEADIDYIPQDISKIIDLRDSLKAVYDKLNSLMSLDPITHKPTQASGENFYNQFNNVFYKVNSHLKQVELTTKSEFVEDEDFSGLAITDQYYRTSDIVVWNDLNKIRTDFISNVNTLTIPLEEAASYIAILRQIKNVFGKPDVVIERFLVNRKLNDAAFENFINSVYVALSKFNLNIPYNVLEAAFAFQIYKMTEDEQGIRSSSVFNDNSRYRYILATNKSMFKDFEIMDYDFFSKLLPNAIEESIKLSENAERISSESLDKKLRQLTTIYLKSMGEFILKYDPTLAGSVTRNANGDKVHKAVDPLPAYQIAIKLHGKDTVDEGLKDVIHSIYSGFEDWFADNPYLNTDNPLINRFLDQFSVDTFAGFQQTHLYNDKRTKREANTFKDIDPKSYFLAMFGLFANRRTITLQSSKPGQPKSVTVFKKIYSQLEGTSTSIMTDGIYESYFDKRGTSIKSSANGKSLFTLRLLSGIRQEYNLIKKNYKEYQTGTVGKVYLDYNEDPSIMGSDGKTPKNRGYKFNEFSDFFGLLSSEEDISKSSSLRARKNLALELIASAKDGVSFEALLEGNPQLDKLLSDQLFAYAQEQFIKFKQLAIEVGIDYEDLPTREVRDGETSEERFDDPETLLKDFFFNNWINNIFINQLIHGPLAPGIKNFADFFKRQKSGAGAGANLYSALDEVHHYRASVINTVYTYIDDADLEKPMQFTPHLDADGNVLPTNVMVEAFNGQSVQTIDRKIRIEKTIGNLPLELEEALHRMKYVCTSMDPEDVENELKHLDEDVAESILQSDPELSYVYNLEKLRDAGIIFNSIKTLSTEPLANIKQSEHTIIRKDVSMLNVPSGSSQLAYNTLDQLYRNAEFYSNELRKGNNLMTIDEVEGDEVDYTEMYRRTILRAHKFFKPVKGNEVFHAILNSMELHRIEQLYDPSSSKRATTKPIQVDWENLELTGGYLPLEDSLTMISNDLTVVQLETGKLSNMVADSIQQKLLIAAQLDENNPEYSEDLKDNIREYKKGISDALDSKLDFIKRLFGSDKKILGKLYQQISSGLKEQGVPSYKLDYFEVDAEGNAINNPALPEISSVIGYYFFSIFNKNVFNKKVEGEKFFLVSPFIKKVVEYTDPTTGVSRIVKSDELKSNPEKYASSPSRYLTIKKGEDGTYYAEVIVPKKLRGLDQKFVEEYLTKFFAVRIPTAARKSMVVCKIVDYMDEAYGNGIMLPAQIHMVAGSDFDIDSLYAYMMASYETADGVKRPYGNLSYFTDKYKMTVKDAKFMEYLHYMGDDSILSDLIKDEVRRIENQGGFSSDSALNFGSYFGGGIEKYMNNNAKILDSTKRRNAKKKQNFKKLIATFNVLQILQDSSIPASPEELELYESTRGYTPVSKVITNKILNAKIKILEDPEIFKISFANLEERADKSPIPYKELVADRGLKETDIFNDYNIHTPTAILKARMILAETKECVGIAASMNKGGALLASINADLAKSLGELELENGEKINMNKIEPSSLAWVNGSIEIFTDGGKNPLPGALNLNTITAPIMLTMYLTGMPQKAAIIFQSLPVIKNIVNDYRKQYGSAYSRENYSGDKTFKGYLGYKVKFNIPEELLSKGVVKVNKRGMLGVVDESKYNLIWTGNISKDTAEQKTSGVIPISNFGFKVTDSKGNSFDKQAEDWIILNHLLKTLELSNGISFGISKLTDVLKGIRPDTISFDRLINTYKNLRRNPENSAFTPNTIRELWDSFPALTAGFRALEYMDDVSKEVMIERTSFMKGLISLFKTINNYEEQDIINDLKSFITMQLMKSSAELNPNLGFMTDIYLEQLDADKFTDGTAVSNFLELKRLYPENRFLQKLKPVTEGTGKNKVRLLELNTSNLDADLKNDVHNDLISLLKSSDPGVKEKAYRIAYHGMIKSGKKADIGSYSEMLPVILSREASNALDSLHHSLIDLDYIIMEKYRNEITEDQNGSLVLPEEAIYEYSKTLSTIISNNFGNTSLTNIITDAIVKLVAYKVDPAEYVRRLSYKRLSMYSNFTITKEDIANLVTTIMPDNKHNVVDDKGNRVKAKPKGNLKIDEYEFFATNPDSDTFTMDLSKITEESYELAKKVLGSIGIYQTNNKILYSFPLYKTNVYGDVYVLKKLNGVDIGNVFVNTLLETTLSTTFNALDLIGSKAVYQRVEKQGSDKINPLAFSTENGQKIFDKINKKPKLTELFTKKTEEAISKITTKGEKEESKKEIVKEPVIQNLPNQFTVNRTVNRMYAVSPTHPSVDHRNKTYREKDGSPITTTKQLDRYFIKNNKLYKSNKMNPTSKDLETGGMIVIPENLYDGFADVLGYGNWDTLKNNPRFQGFLIGVDSIYMYGLNNATKIEKTEPIPPAAPQPVSEPIITKGSFKLLNNGNDLNLSEAEIDSVYQNYVNLMDRKREGKAISRSKFQYMFENLQVYKSKDTYIFGEWDVENNVFRGRLISSVSLRQLSTELDTLLANVSFVASVPDDMGKMLEKKGLYKLDIGKQYNFRGEEMIKNLYFSNKDLVERIFKTSAENVKEEQMKKYDTFYNYHASVNDFVIAYLNYTINNDQKINPKKDVSVGFLTEIKNILKKDSIDRDSINYIKAVLYRLNDYIDKHPEYNERSNIVTKILGELKSIDDQIKSAKEGNKFKYEYNKDLIEELQKQIENPLTVNIKQSTLDLTDVNFLKKLKEIGLYDYTAYKLHNKIKSNRITESDKRSLIESILKNSSLNKVIIDNTDLLNNPKIYSELDNELNKTLATYLSKFGIKTEVLENLQDSLGIDSYAHVDILNKILYTSKNNQKDYPQQAGKIIAYMMQHNPLVTEIMSNMKKSSLFGKLLSKDEMLDAIADLITEQLHKKTNTEVPASILEKIGMLIKQFFEFLSDTKIGRINKNIAFIADNVLIQNQALITSSPFKPGSLNKKISKVSFQEALDKDQFASSIVDKMSDRFILGGSISFSEQGTTWRPKENQVHDLDWDSSYSRKDTIKLFESMYPEGQRVYIRHIHDKTGNNTDTWLLCEDGHTIKNLIQSEDSTKKILAYDIVSNKTGEVVSKYIAKSDSHTGTIVAKAIDIFTTDSPVEKYSPKEFVTTGGTVVKLGNWRSSFEAKHRYGRLKDMWDYNRFIPEENIYNPAAEKSSEKTTTFESTDTASQINKEVNDVIKQKDDESRTCNQ